MNWNEIMLLGSEDHLEHHGIKGQKWGIRRFQNEDGTRIGAKKRKKIEKKREKKAVKQASKDEEDRKVHKDYKEKANTLDDDELKKRIQRMENELKYKNQQKLLYPDKKQERHERFKKAIGDGFNEAVKDLTKSTITMIGKSILKSIGLSSDSGSQQKQNNNNQSKQNSQQKSSGKKNPSMNEQWIKELVSMPPEKDWKKKS